MTGRTRRLIARYVPEAVRARLGLGPDFLIIGTQRGGTTSLYDYLSEHPCIAGAVKKEIEFFDLNYHRGIGWYRAHFPSVLERLYARRARGRKLVTGEATPYYLFHPHAPRRMQEAAPESRLIILLRNPVERAYSHYWHEVRHGSYTRMLWMRRNEQAYPWLNQWNRGVLAARYNQEDTPMQQDTALQAERPDRSLPLLPLDEVVRQGARQLVQRAVEVEVDLFLERYQYLMDDPAIVRSCATATGPFGRSSRGPAPWRSPPRASMTACWRDTANRASPAR